MLLLLCLLLQDDGEKLFAAFEKKLVEAKTLQFKWKIDVTVKVSGTDDDGSALEGELAMRADNRVRFFAKGKFLGKDHAVATVCDGKTLRVKVPDKAAEDGKCPEKLSAGLAKLVVRGGLYAAVAGGRPRLVLDDAWKVSDFRKVEDRVLRFSVETDVKREQFVARLWIDDKSGLGTKRVVRGGDDKIEITITETWSGAMVDAEVPDEEFEFEK